MFYLFKKIVFKMWFEPVFRGKRAILWPPPHPSPHFHPPCLGRRMKVFKRLSTSSLGPHLVEGGKSTWSTLPFLSLPPPSRSTVLHMLLLMCPAAWANPHHQIPAFISIILIVQLIKCAVLHTQNLSSDRCAESCIWDAGSYHFNAFFI